jgi:TPR repeat protein
MYEAGKGVGQDPVAAAIWYALAAGKDDAKATELSLARLDGLGDEVRQAAALRMLRAAGYLQGGAEGELDAAALSAIEIFQRQQGLPVDGLVSNALLVALGQQLDAGAALPENQEL